MTTQIAVRLPDELVGQLDTLVPSLHESRSDAVRRSIELYLYRLACEQDVARYEAQPLTDEELTLADDPGRWSTTPAW
jgi:Arc/MetJ-type ribon-helix-helix transcriptional regulator